jgi:hypothetical protein
MKVSANELRQIIKEELDKAIEENLGDYVGYTTWIPGTKNPMSAKLIRASGDDWWFDTYSSFYSPETTNSILMRKIALNLIGNYVLKDRLPDNEQKRKVADEILTMAAKRGIIKPYKGTVYRGVIFTNFEEMLDTLEKSGNNELIHWLTKLSSFARREKSTSFLSKLTGIETSGVVTPKKPIRYLDLKPNVRNDYFLSFSSSFKIASSYATRIIHSVSQPAKTPGEKFSNYHFPCVLECESKSAWSGYLIDTDWMSYETNRFGTSGALDEVLFVPSLGDDLLVKRIHLPIKEIIKAFKERKAKDKKLDPYGYGGEGYQTFLDYRRN